ncbi:PPC domain-containing DNA-binding protein [Staphylococcus simiae]|uniref:PPC domain-containing protein n=1 Tax=Staphylococcus simiae CCM 7213 = CCUG 51256 TaxID=911238 RepID=G5JL62_9STAP|nr:PPC domain-containing DNA-binding protein [Staphylococcus simiae]EHJ07080.1 hypothetical protein SS7213T_11135 [Staphylococcus simiae CCM 7213 = CCUG 51256]PNZ09964.1 DUF296 domain-containing protein [Staphylococcus simiae]SNV63955.1 putative DUF296-containing protein [Staphylococcus simiae]
MKMQVSQNVILLVLEQGEDIVSAVTKIAEDHSKKFGTVSGIGACDDVTLNFYNLSTQQYEEHHIHQPLELTSLLGNISRIDDKAFAHLHATFGDDQYRTYSGHLAKAIVSATAEIVITLTDMDINREFNDHIGLNLLSPKS